MNGYNVYAEKKFDYNSLDRKKKITSAFSNDTLYIVHKLPRTTEDLGKKLNISFTNVIMKKLSLKLKKILTSCESICCENDKGKFHIFGLDISLLSNLEPIVIEINSKPKSTVLYGTHQFSRRGSNLYENIFYKRSN